MTVDPNSLLNQAVTFADFCTDAKSDIVWRNEQTGETAVWQINNFNSTGAFIPQFDFNWIFATGNFNGAGRSDFFWRNQKTGENQVWLMNGTNITAIKNLPSVDTNWNLSVGNFNGGVNNDIFWHNQTTGENQIWLMNGTNATKFDVTSADGKTLQTFGSDWDYKIADFNGDRNSDIFWHNKQTGENVVWLMKGTTVTLQASVQNFLTPGLDWEEHYCGIG